MPRDREATQGASGAPDAGADGGRGSLATSRGGAADRLVGTTLELLGARGLKHLTMSEVARRAEVSVGSIYNHFADKDALLRAAHEESLRRMGAEIDEQVIFGVSSGPAGVRVLVERLIAVLDANETLIHAFSAQGVLDPQVSRAAAIFTQDLARRFKDRLLALGDAEPFGHASAELAAELCFRLVYDVTVRRVTHGSSFGSDSLLTWSELADELAVACVAYLWPRAPAA